MSLPRRLIYPGTYWPYLVFIFLSCGFRSSRVIEQPYSVNQTLMCGRVFKAHRTVTANAPANRKEDRNAIAKIAMRFFAFFLSGPQQHRNQIMFSHYDSNRNKPATKTATSNRIGMETTNQEL